MTPSDAVTLEEMTRQHVLKTLQQTANKTEAARILGISRKTLYEKCKRWGIVRQWQIITPPAPGNPQNPACQ